MQVDSLNAIGFVDPSQPESEFPVEDKYTMAVDFLYKQESTEHSTRGTYSNRFINLDTAKKYGDISGSRHITFNTMQLVVPSLLKYYIRHHRYMFSQEQLDLIWNTVMRIECGCFNERYIKEQLGAASDGRLYVKVGFYSTNEFGEVIEDYAGCSNMVLGFEGFSDEVVDVMKDIVFQRVNYTPTGELVESQENNGVTINFYSH